MALSIVEVIPIVRGITRTSLSYFTTEKISKGDFIKVPVKSGEAWAVVVDTKSARSVKSDLKTADFTLKKINKKKVLGTLPPHFLRAAEELSRYYASTLGSALTTLIPKLLLEKPELILTTPRREKLKLSREPVLIQMEKAERFLHYKSVIRENFAKGQSVVFVAPTHEEALRAYEDLGRGIRDFTYMFSLGLPRKKAAESLKKARENPHAILYITTPAGLGFDRRDIETIIFERENSRAYRTLSRPFISYKTFVEFLAKESRRTLVLGDSVLSLETLVKEKEGKYHAYLPLKWRLPAAPTTLIDAKSGAKDQEGFEVLTPELKEFIRTALEERSKVFLFGVRKGVAPSTVCGDCGTVLACLNCGSPVVLHKRNDEPIYICHACRAERKPSTNCDYCKSWKLVPLGIGTDRIAKEVLAHFPRATVCVLDKYTANTGTEAKKVIKKFMSEGDILVGTELVFSHLETVPYSAVVSLDSLFSIPDFGINERIFYLVSHIREMSSKAALVQSRNIGKNILFWASSGSILDFYKNEIAEREALSYPPFSIFIKVTTLTTEKNLVEKAAYLEKLFKEYEPHFMKRHVTKTKIELSMIMREKTELWPDPTLSEKLALLTPDFSTKVDPESII
jgi:primosomal protein N'